MLFINHWVNLQQSFRVQVHPPRLFQMCLSLLLLRIDVNRMKSTFMSHVENSKQILKFFQIMLCNLQVCDEPTNRSSTLLGGFWAAHVDDVHLTCQVIQKLDNVVQSSDGLPLDSGNVTSAHALFIVPASKHLLNDCKLLWNNLFLGFWHSFNWFSNFFKVKNQTLSRTVTF